MNINIKIQIICSFFCHPPLVRTLEYIITRIEIVGCAAGAVTKRVTALLCLLAEWNCYLHQSLMFVRQQRYDLCLYGELGQRFKFNLFFLQFELFALSNLK